MSTAINAMLVKQSAASQSIDLNEKFGDGYTFSVVSSNGAAVDASIDADGVLTLDYGSLGHSDIRIIATDAQGHSVTDDFRVRVAGDNAYTIAVLPDTQDYTKGYAPSETFNHMTQWLVDNKDSLGIQFVSHVGDVTYTNTRAEWAKAVEAMSILDGKIPYSLTSGNHDIASGGNASSRTQDYLSEYFSVERQSQVPGFGGTYDKEPTNFQNNYYTFTAPDGTKWMSLSLEFGPRDDVLRWAGEVVEAHPDHRVMLTTHSYMAGDGRVNPTSEELTWDNGATGYGVGNDIKGASDGDGIWDAFVSKYPNIAFTFSGHNFIDGAETQVNYGAGGQPVMQMFVNYQNGVARELTGNGNSADGNNGGNGAIRLITIDPDNNKVYSETYFTEFDDYLDGFRGKEELDRDGLTGNFRGHQEEFDVDLSAPDAWGIAKAGDDQFVNAADGDVANVTLDASKSIVVEGDVVTYTWKDADGNVVATGANPTVEFESGTRVLTLEVTDSKGHVSTDAVRVTVSGERTLMSENFNDGGAEGWSVPTAVQKLVTFGSSTDFGLPAMTGGADDVLSFPHFTQQQHLRLDPEGASIPADGVVRSYSLVMDVLIPDEEAWTAIVQTQNANSGDAELYLRNDGNGVGSFGTVGAYHGAFKYGEWQRVAFTFDYDSASNTTVMSKYIQGELVGTQTLSDAYRYSIDANDGFLLFTDGGSDTSRGYASSILFSDKALSQSEIAGFGTADADGISAAPIAGATQFDFRDGSLSATWGSGKLATPAVAAADTPLKVVGSVHSGDTEGTLKDLTNKGTNTLIWNDDEASNWSDYVFEVSLSTTDRTGQVGVVFNHQDSENFYRLTFDVNGNARTLVKVQDGVSTVLAEAHQGLAMGMEHDLKVVSVNGEIRAFIGGKDIFGGPVVDASPLQTGTVGVYSSAQDTATFDNVIVNKAVLTAHGESAARALDTGDGTAALSLTATGSYGPDEITAYRWLLDGELVGQGKDVVIDLPNGTTGLTLEVTDSAGKVSSDFVKVEIAEKSSLLLDEDFDSGLLSGAWTMVDEGEDASWLVDGNTKTVDSDEANWYIEDGKLVQDANVYSRQLTNSRNSNDSDVWGRGYSPLGDGDYILRKGTYMLYEGEGASQWSDYSVEFTFSGGGNDSLGLMFYYQDEDNYYKLELDNTFGLYQLTRLVDGVETILARTAGRYTVNEDQDLRVDVNNHVIDITLDGERIFEDRIEDRKHDGGTFGLYNWSADNGVTYDDVKVVMLDQPPTAPELSANRVSEKATAGTVVGELSSTDPEGKALTYTLANDAGGLFRIATGNGTVQIVLNGALNYDAARSHTIEVLVSDGSKTTKAEFTIDVIDVIDVNNPVPTPVNTAPANVAFAGQAIAENADLGAIVGTLSATDAEGDAITWSLSGGDGKFALKDVNGVMQVVVNGSLDYETQASHTVTVIASDGKLQTSTNFTISVADIDEGNLPEIPGDGGDNELEGDAGDNLLTGKGGDDILSGAGGNDELKGGKGSDELDGGEGDDLLIGSTGADTLTGGDGADTFFFSAVQHSNRKNTDVITDFDPSEGDIIDLSGIDANGRKGGDQTFKFIGQDDFGGKPGQLRFETSKGLTVIEGDTDGDGKADFVLHLDGKHSVTADFFDL